MTPREIINLSSGLFNVNEKWGDLDKMNPLILQMLIHARRTIGKPFIINSGYREGDKGQHGKGNAVDWYIKDMRYLEAIAEMETWLKRSITIGGEIFHLDSFCGFGLYPYWNNCGFHLDCRGVKARWAYDKEGKEIPYNDGKDIVAGRG